MNDTTPTFADLDLFETIRRKQEELNGLIAEFERTSRRDRIQIEPVQSDQHHQPDQHHCEIKTSKNISNFPAIPKRSPFYGRPRAEEIYSTFKDAKGRYNIGLVLGKRGGVELWGLLLTAIDAGLLTPNKYVSHDAKLTLRALFPAATFSTRSALAHIDLGNERDRARVRDEILPAMIANKDRLLADPNCLEDVIRQNQQARSQAQREAADLDRYREAVADLPKTEMAVTMFGQRLWPRLNERYGAYDYDQLCTAIWYFRTQDAVLFRGHADARSRAIEIRHSTKWFDDYVARTAPDEFRGRMRRIFGLVHTMTFLLEKAPDADCRPPPFKQIEG